MPLNNEDIYRTFDEARSAANVTPAQGGALKADRVGIDAVVDLVLKYQRNALNIDGKTPDEAYAKLVETARATAGSARHTTDPHTYALNHLVKRAQEIGYADGIAAGQPKQLPTTPGSVILWTNDFDDSRNHLVLDSRGAWGNAAYTPAKSNITDWTLIHDAGQEQNA